ncbi:HAH_0734 family protein [Halovenus marina]|uniref:HAH_0734 family protein n=1 Tax=Halovenus marina TaxID=3396621 RepID=UPI003F5546FF
MQKLIIRGDPGIRKGATIEFEGEEYVCFGINRQGEWNGPDRPQLWCTIGSVDEREAYERREFIPLHLDVDDVDAEDIEVIEAAT